MFTNGFEKTANTEADRAKIRAIGNLVKKPTVTKTVEKLKEMPMRPPGMNHHEFYALMKKKGYV